MTRRERLERRLDNRRTWSASRAAKANASFEAARKGIEHIPPGQPILVGHHSERHHRRDLARHDNRMRAGVEHADMAEHHQSKAAGLAAQLDRTVFSDDADAIEQLEARIAANERTADLYTRVNAAWRKTKGTTADRVAALTGMDLGDGHIMGPKLAATIESTMRLCPWLRSPFDTTNVRARIRTDRQRIEELTRAAAFTARVQALCERPGWTRGTLGQAIVDDAGHAVLVAFDRKPDPAVREGLKVAGFRWHAVSEAWCGRWSPAWPDGRTRLCQAARQAILSDELV